MAQSSEPRDLLGSWILPVAGLFLLAGHGAASLSYSNGSWGFHSGFFLPRAWTWILLAVGCVLCLAPMWSRSAAPPAPGTAPPASRSRARWDLLIAAAFVPVFWIFRMPVHFLGDGRLMIRLLEDGFWFHPHEPLNRLMHAGVLRAISPVFGWSGELAYSLLSVIAGFAYVYAALRLGRLWGRPLFVAAFLVTLGTVQLFFGYTESYAVATAMMMTYLLLAAEYLAGARRLVWVAIALLVAVGSHFALWFLLPSFLYLLWAGPSTNSTGSFRRFAAGAVVSFLALILVAATVPGRAPDRMGLLLVPLSPNPVAQYTLFSWRHLLDWLNEQILISPLGWVAAVGFAIALGTDRELRRSRTFVFLMLASLGGVLFSLLLRPGLGGSRDWDLWSLGSLPYTVAVAGWISRGLGRKRAYRAAAWILCVTGALHVIPWIAVNSDRRMGLDRFERMTEDNPLWTPKRMAAARAELAGFYLDARAWAESAHHFRKATDLDPGTARYWAQMGASELMLGRLSEAETSFSRAIELDPAYPKARYGLAQVHLRQGRTEDAEVQFRRAAELEPGQPSTHFNLGNLWRARGDTRAAIGAYRRALDLDPETSLYWYELARTLETDAALEAEAREAWTRVRDLTAGNPNERAWFEEADRRLETSGRSR